MPLSSLFVFIIIVQVCVLCRLISSEKPNPRLPTKQIYFADAGPLACDRLVFVLARSLTLQGANKNERDGRFQLTCAGASFALKDVPVSVAAVVKKKDTKSFRPQKRFCPN